MNKNTIILSVVFSIISLIWILLTYFGLIRHFKISMCSCETFAKKYIKLPRVTTNNKVIVSIYTKEPDLNNLKNTMNSILDQTVHPDQIIISTPPNVDIKIPDFIQNNNICIVHKLTKDYGESSVFISPLLREKDGNTNIILVNDKNIYGTDFIETLVETSENFPNDVIYISGYSANSNKEIDVIDIACGVLIKPIFFTDDSVLNIEEGPNGVKENPDIFLSQLLHKNKINLKNIKYTENVIKTKSKADGSVINYYAAYFPSFK